MNETQEQLKAARELITDAFVFLGVRGLHQDECASAQFHAKNKHLPINHPAWKSAPACNCIVNRLASYLERH